MHRDLVDCYYWNSTNLPKVGFSLEISRDKVRQGWKLCSKYWSAEQEIVGDMKGYGEISRDKKEQLFLEIKTSLKYVEKEN